MSSSSLSLPILSVLGGPGESGPEGGLVLGGGLAWRKGVQPGPEPRPHLGRNNVMGALGFYAESACTRLYVFLRLTVFTKKSISPSFPNFLSGKTQIARHQFVLFSDHVDDDLVESLALGEVPKKGTPSKAAKVNERFGNKDQVSCHRAEEAVGRNKLEQ